MTPDQWNTLLNPRARLSHGARQVRVAIEVRAFLMTLIPGVVMSTNELVEALYPRAIADQSLKGDIARGELYKRIGQLAHDKLSDCCVKGEKKEKKYMGHVVRPWIWFCPENTDVCSHCGQTLPASLDIEDVD